MDVTEVVDASDHTSPAASFVRYEEQEPAKATPSQSTSHRANDTKEDSGGLSESSPLPDVDASSTSSTSTVVDSKAAAHEECQVVTTP